jgi:uncharacterized protein
MESPEPMRPEPDDEGQTGTDQGMESPEPMRPEHTDMGDSAADDETYFAVIREPGARWDPARPLQEQAGWPEHLEFMNALAEDGFIVVGGPLSDGRRALHIVNARSETEIRRRFDDDPWTAMKLLSIVSVEPWQALLGQGLPSAAETL